MYNRGPHEMYAVFIYRAGRYMGTIRFVWPWRARLLAYLINRAYGGDEWHARLDVEENRLVSHAPVPVAQLGLAGAL